MADTCTEGNRSKKLKKTPRRGGTVLKRSRRLRAWLSNWQEWLALAILLLTLGIAVRSIEDSNWISPQPALTLVLLLAVLSGLLAKSRLPFAPAFIVSLVIGGAVTVWQTYNLLPPWLTVSGNWLIAPLQSLWLGITVARPSENTIHFALFLIMCTGLIGYLSSWFLLRRGNAWVGVFLGAATILVNLSNLGEESYRSFFVYTLAALVLAAYVSLTKRSYLFQRVNLRYPARGMLAFMASALSVSLVLASVSWFAPEVRAGELETFVSTKMSLSKDFDDYWMNLFAAVPAKTTLIRSTHQQTLNFASPVNLSTDVQFVITSPKQPSYWRTRRFDIYNSWSWSSSPASEQSLNSGAPSPLAESLAQREELIYTVLNKLKTDILLTAGELVSTDISTLTYSYNAKNTDGTSAKLEQDPSVTMVAAVRLLKLNESYKVTAGLTLATPEQLSSASATYPRWVSEKYLQLPSSLPERMKQTSRLIIRRAQAQTPYEKVIAIKSYLSRLPYLQTGTAPPEGVDGVDHFISVARTGNCTNFASAMVVMLRAIGVPARFATGYLPGDWSEANKTSSVRAKDYHAWPEVYFPGYGWMEFEATPLPNRGVADTGGEGGLDDMVDETIAEEAAAAVEERSWTGLSLTIAGIMLALFILAMTLRRRFRHLTGVQYAAEVYGRMGLYGSLLRLPQKLGQTPLEYSHELGAAFPAQAEAIDSIARSYVRTRFSQSKELETQERNSLRQSWRTVSRALLRRLFRVRR
ncbi:MAG: transglutaminase domain-containing protein [Dehalococcoidia bacterium]|nr:transglutaminase domain-containing protein [Dehalococcoidia bacterium]